MKPTFHSQQSLIDHMPEIFPDKLEETNKKFTFTIKFVT